MINGCQIGNKMMIKLQTGIHILSYKAKNLRNDFTVSIIMIGKVNRVK